MKKVDFALGFYCLDAVSLKSKENNEKKAKKLGNRQYFSISLPFWRFSSLLWFSPPFLPGFALGLLGIGRQDSQLDK